MQYVEEKSRGLSNLHVGLLQDVGTAPANGGVTFKRNFKTRVFLENRHTTIYISLSSGVDTLYNTNVTSLHPPHFLLTFFPALHGCCLNC